MEIQVLVLEKQKKYGGGLNRLMESQNGINTEINKQKPV